MKKFIKVTLTLSIGLLLEQTTFCQKKNSSQVSPYEGKLRTQITELENLKEEFTSMKNNFIKNKNVSALNCVESLINLLINNNKKRELALGDYSIVENQPLGLKTCAQIIDNIDTFLNKIIDNQNIPITKSCELNKQLDTANIKKTFKPLRESANANKKIKDKIQFILDVYTWLDTNNKGQLTCSTRQLIMKELGIYHGSVLAEAAGTANWQKQGKR